MRWSRSGIVRALGAAGLICAAAAGPARAAEIVALSPTVSSGTQNFNNLFGIDFNANQAVNLTQLGVFDNGGDGVLNTNTPTQPIVIQLWNRDTGVALATMSFGGGAGNGTAVTAGAGKVFFKPLATPLTLTAGGHYYVSEDFGGTEQFGNVGNAGYTVATPDTGGGLISFVGKGRASNVHNAMFNGNDAASGGTSTATAPPATTNGFIDAGPANRYTGPNFQFEAAPTPDPGTTALAGVAAAAALARRRRPRRPI
jgi:hypothetical protein